MVRISKPYTSSQSSVNQKVRICQRKWLSSQVPATSPRLIVEHNGDQRRQAEDKAAGDRGGRSDADHDRHGMQPIDHVRQLHQRRTNPIRSDRALCRERSDIRAPRRFLQQQGVTGRRVEQA